MNDTDIKAEHIMKEISEYINDEVTILDAVIHYAQKHDLEIELVGEIIKRSPILKAKVREDAEKLRLVEKSNRLPV